MRKYNKNKTKYQHARVGVKAVLRAHDAPNAYRAGQNRVELVDHVLLHTEIDGDDIRQGVNTSVSACRTLH